MLLGLLRHVAGWQRGTLAEEEIFHVSGDEFLPAPRQAQVYRVSVPRSTLASLGFPVEEELHPESRLTADVLMDQDGLARAVRLVKTVY